MSLSPSILIAFAMFCPYAYQCVEANEVPAHGSNEIEDFCPFHTGFEDHNRSRSHALFIAQSDSIPCAIFLRIFANSEASLLLADSSFVFSAGWCFKLGRERDWGGPHNVSTRVVTRVTRGFEWVSRSRFKWKKSQDMTRVMTRVMTSAWCIWYGADFSDFRKWSLRSLLTSKIFSRFWGQGILSESGWLQSFSQGWLGVTNCQPRRPTRPSCCYCQRLLESWIHRKRLARIMSELFRTI